MDSPCCPTEMIRMLASFPTSPISSPRQGHTERPYKCTKPGCFLRFKRKFTLKEHIKTHTGEKPFVCPVQDCGKTFTTSGNLARHKRLHPWLKPVVCLVDGCDRSFSNELKLEEHMKRHFKGPPEPQVCPIAHCGKQFSTAGNLTRHFKQNHHNMSLAEAKESRNRESSTSEMTDCTDHQEEPFCPTRMYYDASRAYNPLMNEVSDVTDEELLAALECLF